MAGESAGHDLSAADVAYWAACQQRIAGYLTTNGLIEISLCGLYATSVAVLIAFGQSLADKHDYVVFNLLVPSFSLVVLTLAVNVYAWIRLQLEYLALISTHPEGLRHIPTYEQWKALCQTRWLACLRHQRISRLFVSSVQSLVLLPFKVRDIYHYYFLLYIATGFANLAYAASRGTPWQFLLLYTAIAWLLLGVGSSECAVLRWVAPAVRLDLEKAVESTSNIVRSERITQGEALK